MSADNWAVCPICQENRNGALLVLEGQVREAYGTLPLPEYEALRDRCAAAKIAGAIGPTIDMLTFREDWEIGLIDGTAQVLIRYSGTCDVCGAKAKYRTTLDVTLRDA